MNPLLLLALVGAGYFVLKGGKGGKGTQLALGLRFADPGNGGSKAVVS